MWGEAETKTKSKDKRVKGKDALRDVNKLIGTFLRMVVKACSCLSQPVRLVKLLKPHPSEEFS